MARSRLFFLVLAVSLLSVTSLVLLQPTFATSYPAIDIHLNQYIPDLPKHLNLTFSEWDWKWRPWSSWNPDDYENDEYGMRIPEPELEDVVVDPLVASQAEKELNAQKLGLAEGDTVHVGGGEHHLAIASDFLATDEDKSSSTDPNASPYHVNGLYVLPSPFSRLVAPPEPEYPSPPAPERKAQQILPLSDGETLLVKGAKHPMLELIANAEKEWNEKLGRQSKTLEECVREYRRRYGRKPPKGFELWWDYAQKNKVHLPDEYDQIFRDLQVFFALEPNVLLERSREVTTQDETFTVNLYAARTTATPASSDSPAPEGETTRVQTRVRIRGPDAELRRATDFADLVRRVARWIPAGRPGGEGVNLTFTRHDQPRVQLGWHRKEAMWKAAEEGRYFDPESYISHLDPRISNWANGCPPNSPLRLHELGQLSTSHSSHPDFHSSAGGLRRSFIYSHHKSMEICHRPEVLSLHGFTRADGTAPGILRPMFTFAKTSVHSDVLVTPLEQYSDTYIGEDMDWEQKQWNKLLWRGSSTGAEFRTNVEWWKSQRARLVFLTNGRGGYRNPDPLADSDVKPDTTESQLSDDASIPSGGAVEEVEVLVETAEGVDRKREKWGEVNEKIMNVAFAGSAVQCDEETCATLERQRGFRNMIGLDESYTYKYLVDVDGNGWSGRFHRLMSTKSLVLKSSIFPEWYTERVQPWVHYVPLKIDYTDLFDIMAFFVGDLDGKGAHEDMAMKIAGQGKEWARDHWRREDMAAYVFRLLLEWSRLMRRGIDGEEVDYTGPGAED